MTPLILFALLAADPSTPAPYYCPGWAQSYEVTVDRWADAYLVPRWLGRSTVANESGYDPEAEAFKWTETRGRWHKTDKVLAHGLTMVSANPEHEREHVEAAGLTLADWNWRDPDQSARVGMCFLGSLLTYFGREVRPSVAGYNAGRGRAAAWWFDGRALPRETVKYLKGVLHE